MGKKSITLSVSALENKLTQLAELDTKIVAARGTAAEWKNKGNEAARSTSCLDWEFALASFIPSAEWTVGQYVDNLHNFAEEADEFVKELSTAWIKANSGADETAALRTLRDELAASATAMRQVFSDLGIEDLPEIPAAPSGARSSSGGTRSPKISGVHFYRVEEGQRIYQSDQQDSLSSVAFYHFAKCGVSALREALAKLGHVDETKSWEGTVTVGDKTRTIGWEVSTPEPTIPEANKSWGIFTKDGELLKEFSGPNAETEASDATMTGEYPDDAEVAFINK